jgi:hypothetical protein
MINLYLDYVRPVPPGWVLVKTVDEANALLLQGIVQRASLDHDLGACPDCLGGKIRRGVVEGYSVSADAQLRSLRHRLQFGLLDGRNWQLAERTADCALRQSTGKS